MVKDQIVKVVRNEGRKIVKVAMRAAIANVAASLVHGIVDGAMNAIFSKEDGGSYNRQHNKNKNNRNICQDQDT